MSIQKSVDTIVAARLTANNVERLDAYGRSRNQPLTMTSHAFLLLTLLHTCQHTTWSGDQDYLVRCDKNQWSTWCNFALRHELPCAGLDGIQLGDGGDELRLLARPLQHLDRRLVGVDEIGIEQVIAQ